MAGPNNVEIIDKSSWLKWHIVLAVSAPVAIGFGTWYILKKNKSDPPPKIGIDDSISEHQPCNSTITPSEEDKSANKSTSKVDEHTELPAKEETPLERTVALKTSGNTFFKSRNYEDAIRCYTEAIEICPEHEQSTLSLCYQNRAATHEQMQNYKGVIDDCTAALALDPKYTKALQRRAKAYEQTGELTHCLEDTTAVCILENFKNERTLFTADRLLQQVGKESAKKAIENRKTVLLSKHFVKAYFVSFTNDPVIKHFRADVNGHNELENVLDGVEKAKKCLLNGEFEEVVPACNKELEKNPEHWEALLLRATMLFLVGEQKKALADFDTIIEGDCPSIDIKVNALIKRASLYLQLDAPEMSAVDRFNMSMKNEVFIPEKCMKDFAAAENLDPTNSDIYHHRGQVHLLMDRMDSAVDDFKKALAKKPNMPVVQVQLYYAQYRLATITKDLELIANTIQLFKELMSDHPDCIEAYSLFIQICTDQQDFEQADEYFKRAIKADPGNATIRVQRATLYLQWKADIPKAIELIEEAIKIDDRCEYGYETLGTIEVQRGNLSRAITLFESGLEYAKSERELAHIYSLRDAAKAQAVVADRLGMPFAFKPS